MRGITLLLLKLAIAIIAFQLHVKAGVAITIVLIVNETIDYFMTRAIARATMKENEHA